MPSIYDLMFLTNLTKDLLCADAKYQKLSILESVAKVLSQWGLFIAIFIYTYALKDWDHL